MVKLTLLTLLLAVGSYGFVVPEGLPNGIYSVDFDPDTGLALGEPTLVHHLNGRYMPTKVAVAPRQQSTPPPLENPRPACANYDLNRGDFNVAKSQFESVCTRDTQYQANQAVVITYGNAIAYMCNFNGVNRCWQQEYNEASGIIDRTCGQNRAGTVYVDRWKKTYGRDVQGANICL
jgi:hypothetical protein